jgi:uncharacterized membrane protein
MRNGWFSPVNSLVYGLGLILGGWLVFRLLVFLKIRIDARLYVALTPFIAFAGVTRTLRDYIYFNAAGSPEFLASFTAHMNVIQQNTYDYIFARTGNSIFAYTDSLIIAWFPTPGSYIITFFLALLSLFVSILIQRYSKLLRPKGRRGAEIPYWKTLFVLGFIMFMINAVLLPVNSFAPLVYIGLVSLGWTALFFCLNYSAELKIMKRMDKKARKVLKEIFTKTNSAILSAHFFDATATFFAIAVFSTMSGQGYTEQHFLSRELMPFLGPQVMFLLKFIVVVPALYLISKNVKDRELRNFLLLVILILGLAPAARNLARLMAGV